MDHGEGEVKKFHSAGAVVRAMVDKSSQTDAQNGFNRRLRSLSINSSV